MEIACQRHAWVGGVQAFGAGECLDLGESVVGGGFNERLSGREVPVDGAYPDAGSLRDLGHLHLDAALGEEGAGGFQDAETVALGVGARSTAWGGWRA
jgi:hypothetical protein